MSSILSTFVPVPAEDVVGIFDENGNQVFSIARPVRCEIKRPTKIFTHPLENQRTLTDHKIIDQVEIEMTLLLRGERGIDAYRSIVQANIESQVFEIRTKFDSFPNMEIFSVPHNELPGQFDTALMKLSFIEIQESPSSFAETSTTINTQERGRQEPEAATASETEQSSLAYRLIFGD